MALMHQENPIIDSILNAKNPYKDVKNRVTLSKHSESIKNELRSIYNKIQGGNDIYICSSIRQLFDKFDKQYEKQINENIETIEWLKEQQEPNDVIQFLTRAFDINKNTVAQNIVNNEENSPRKALFNDIIIEANEQNVIDIKDYIPITINKFINDINKKETITKRKYLESDGLMINILRGYKNKNNNKKSKTKLIIPEYINLNKKLELISIIIHHGNSIDAGHYTCLIKHKSKWYHFDDMNSDFDYIGDFKDIDNNVFKNVVSLIYV
jgi:ubiquitin C-terminal hydrolase